MAVRRRYLLSDGDARIGYASIMDAQEQAGTLFEFYLAPPFRALAPQVLRDVIAHVGPAAVECQSNDPVLAPLVREPLPRADVRHGAL